MAVTKKDVEYIASLAKLNFAEDEVVKLTAELNEVLNYMDKLNELDTGNVEPLSHPVENVNAFRNDDLGKSVTSAEALKNAPENNDEYFLVPKVINVE